MAYRAGCEPDPYSAVLALSAWAGKNRNDLEGRLILAGRSGLDDLNLRELINVSYMAITEHMEQKDRQRLDMELRSVSRTGMLGLPNARHGGPSEGTDALMALMGGPPPGQRQ